MPILFSLSWLTDKNTSYYHHTYYLAFWGACAMDNKAYLSPMDSWGSHFYSHSKCCAFLFLIPLLVLIFWLLRLSWCLFCLCWCCCVVVIGYHFNFSHVQTTMMWWKIKNVSPIDLHILWFLAPIGWTQHLTQTSFSIFTEFSNKYKGHWCVAIWS